MVQQQDALHLLLIDDAAYRLVHQVRLPGEHGRAQAVHDDLADAVRGLGQRLELLTAPQRVERQEKGGADEQKGDDDRRGQTDREPILQRYPGLCFPHSIDPTGRPVILSVRTAGSVRA
jgi:hypothetical protein